MCQQELLRSQEEVQRLLDKMEDLTQERGEMVSHRVHSRLLKIADERADEAEKRVHELEAEVQCSSCTHTHTHTHIHTHTHTLKMLACIHDTVYIRHRPTSIVRHSPCMHTGLSVCLCVRNCQVDLLRAQVERAKQEGINEEAKVGLRSQHSIQDRDMVECFRLYIQF